MKLLSFSLFVCALLRLVQVDGGGALRYMMGGSSRDFFSAVVYVPTGENVKKKYVVVLDERVAVEQQLEHLPKVFKYSVDEPTKIKKALNIGGYFKAFSATMNNATLQQVLQLPHVRYVVQEENLRFKALEKNNREELHSDLHRRKRRPCSIQSNADWGLERTSVKHFHNTKKYTYSERFQGQGVEVYVIDSGVFENHYDFERRATLVKDYSKFSKPDIIGHGTLVASLIIGRRYGIAKKARVAAVRVADKDGDATVAQLVESIQWVASQARLKRSTVILNFSIGRRHRSSLIDFAARDAVRDGVVFVTSAGNEGHPACLTSPAGLAETITVAGSDRNDRFWVSRSGSSNYGSCVDIFAPSADILGAGITGPYSTQTESGTSFGTALVSGILARLLSENPRRTPAELKQYLLRRASRGILQPAIGHPWPDNTPNLLVHEPCY